MFRSSDLLLSSWGNRWEYTVLLAYNAQVSNHTANKTKVFHLFFQWNKVFFKKNVQWFSSGHNRNKINQVILWQNYLWHQGKYFQRIFCNNIWFLSKLNFFSLSVCAAIQVNIMFSWQQPVTLPLWNPDWYQFWLLWKDFIGIASD